ncbi:MAG: hypothetical protein DYG90_08880 [Chloroflexi bacterium CFX6]|nr:hypothetical protein [Chloroflexi bacterium CFX6]
MGTTNFDTVAADAFVDAAAGIGVGVTSGSGAPLGDPGVGNRVYLDTDDGSLYTWDGAAWAAVSGSSLDGVTDGPNDNVYLGSNQTVGTGDDNVMIGADMDAQNDPYRAVAVGHQCAPLGPSCVVVGRLAYASDFGTAIGNGAGAGVSGTALGNGAVATDDGIAIGDGVSALADEAVIGGASHTLRSGGQIAIEVVALAPAADPGFAGVVKYCTADSKLYIWTGAAWRSIATV